VQTRLVTYSSLLFFYPFASHLFDHRSNDAIVALSVCGQSQSFQQLVPPT
jgi:hypothetical protein